MGNRIKLDFESPSSSLIAKIGFGTWGLGGSAYGDISTQDAERLVTYAYSRGIRTFDTSPLYGDGRSERIIGRALVNESRESFRIISKAGLYSENGQEKRNFAGAFLASSLKASLLRLGVDWLDHFLLHSPSVSEIQTGHFYFDAIEREITNGTIKNFGISLKSPSDLKQIPESENLDTIEFNFSLMDQRIFDLESEIESTRSYFKIARTPYNFGFLTNSPPPLHPPRDLGLHLSKWSQSQFKSWHEFRNIWSLIASENNLTLQQLALSFVISSEFVDLVIPGFMNVAHIDDAIRVAEMGLLTFESMELLKEIYSNHESKFGKLSGIL